MSTVLVTGATGCVGHYVTRALVERTDHDLLLLVRDPAKLHLPASPRVRILRGDLHGAAAVPPLPARITSAVHLAAAWGPEDAARAVNVDGTLNTFRAATAAGAGRFVYASSLGPSPA